MKTHGLDKVVYGGVTWRRRRGKYFDQFYGTIGYRITTLHRFIFEEAHGPLEPGWKIRHADDDHDNHDLDNLHRRRGSAAFIAWHEEQAKAQPERIAARKAKVAEKNRKATGKGKWALRWQRMKAEQIAKHGKTKAELLADRQAAVRAQRKAEKEARAAGREDFSDLV